MDQETAKGPFRSSSQAATCYYQSNHSKEETIPLSALPKAQQANLPAYSKLTLFNAERQAGKLWTPTFKSFGLTRPGNRTLFYRLRGEHSNY